MPVADSFPVRVLRNLYRRFAGPEATLGALPLSLLRALRGTDEICTRVNGSVFKVDLRDTVITPQLLFQRRYEPAQTILLETLLRPGDRVVDVGAHIGYYSVLFGKTVRPDGTVLALEPHAGNAALLETNVALNGLESVVTVVRAAAGEHEGSATLRRVDTGNRGDSRVLTDSSSRHNLDGATAIAIPTVTVDQCVRSWPNVDLVKMDVQGYEPWVLSGMRETLAANADIMLVVEYWPWGLYNNGFEPRSLLRQLRAQQFELWEIPEVGRLTRLDDDDMVSRLDGTREFTNFFCARGRSLERLSFPGIAFA